MDVELSLKLCIVKTFTTMFAKTPNVGHVHGDLHVKKSADTMLVTSL